MRSEFDLAIAGRFANRVAEDANAVISDERAGLLGLIACKSGSKLKSPAERLNIGDLHGHTLLDARRIGVGIDDDPAGSLVDWRGEVGFKIGEGFNPAGGGGPGAGRLPLSSLVEGKPGGEKNQKKSPR